MINIFFCIFNLNASSEESKYIQYKVEKKDTLFAIMKKHNLKPIYGKKGYLKEILKLNPNKINTKGNLIYPGETVTIPIINKNINTINRQPNTQEFSTTVSYKYNRNFSNIKKLPENLVYLVYKVKKNDMISVLLKKYNSFPIYGKNGTLSETLELNPNKKSTKGDLIFPNELITLPITVEVLKQLSDEEKKTLKIIYFNEKKGIHEEISYFDFIAIQNKKENNPEKSLPAENNKEINKSITAEYKIELFGKIRGKQIQLHWIHKNNKKLRYEVRKSINKDNDFITFEKNYYGNKLIDYDVFLGQIYFYQVIGIDKFGHKIDSNIIQILPPPTEPKKLTTKLIDNNAFLTWEQSRSKSEVNYDIYRSLSSQKGYFLLTKDIKETSYLDKTLKPGYTYYYKIKAKDKEGNSNFSNESSLHSYPPKVNLSGYLKADYVFLEWNKAQTKANISYDIYRSTHENNNYKIIFPNYKGFFARDKDISKNEIYFYKIVAKNADNVANESNIIEIFASLDNIFLQAEIGDKKVKMHWNKIHGSNKFKYSIFKSSDSTTEFNLIKENIIQNQFEDINVTEGHKYIYKVVGLDKLNHKKESNSVVVILNPRSLKNINLTLKDKKNVLINWEIPKSNITTKFKILKSYSPEKKFIAIADELTENFYLDKNCKPGHKIFYKLLLKNANNVEIESSVVSIITTPEPPQKIRGRVIEKEILLEWETVESNLPVTYEIYRGFQTLENMEYFTKVTDKQIYHDKHILPDEDYYYVIKSKVENVSSSISDVTQVTSHSSYQVPSSIQTGFGVSYYKLEEYNKNSGSYANLYSAPSTNSYISSVQNWDETFKSHFGLGVLYFDLLGSPIYTLNQREFLLPYIMFGLKNDFSNHIFIEYKNMIQKDIYYQSQVNAIPKSMQDNSIYIDNQFFQIGYDFIQKNNLHLNGKLGYILTLPKLYNVTKMGHGYNAELELLHQISQYGLGFKVFYSNRTTNTENVKSTITENGILVHFTLDLGYL